MQVQHSSEDAAAVVAVAVPVEEGTPAAAELVAEPASAPLEAATSPGETAVAVAEPVAVPSGEAEPSPGPPASAQEGAAEATPAVAQEGQPPPQEGAAGAEPAVAEVVLQPLPLPLPADASPEEELHWATEQLGALGYEYTENDELRAVADGGKFTFRGQPHYERLGLAVEAYVQALLTLPPRPSPPLPGRQHARVRHT